MIQASEVFGKAYEFHLAALDMLVAAVRVLWLHRQCRMQLL